MSVPVAWTVIRVPSPSVPGGLVIVPSATLAPGDRRSFPPRLPRRRVPKELPELTLVTPAVLTSPAALTMKLPVAPPAPTPAAALPPMALTPALKFAAPAVVVTEIVPALPPRAFASVSALPPLALMATAPGRRHRQRRAGDRHVAGVGALDAGARGRRAAAGRERCCRRR